MGILDGDSDPAGDALKLTTFNGQTVGSGGSLSTSLSGAWMTVDSDGGFSFTAAATTTAGTYALPYSVSNGSVTATGTVNVSVTPAAPVITVPAVETASWSGYTAQALNIVGLSVADLNTSGNMELTLSVGSGTLSLATALLTASGDLVEGNGTNEVTVFAPLSSINAALATSNGLTYTAQSMAGSDSLAATYLDLATQQSDSKTVPLNVNDSFGFDSPKAYATATASLTVDRNGSALNSASVYYTVVPDSGAMSTGTLSFAANQVTATLNVSVSAGSAMVLLTGASTGSLIDPSLATAAALNVASSSTPVAMPQSFSTGQGQTLASGPGVDGLGLLQGDFDLAGDDLTLTKIGTSTVTSGQTLTLPSGAALTINSDGSFVYDPASSFSVSVRSRHVFHARVSWWLSLTPGGGHHGSRSLPRSPTRAVLASRHRGMEQVRPKHPRLLRRPALIGSRFLCLETRTRQAGAGRAAGRDVSSHPTSRRCALGNRPA